VLVLDSGAVTRLSERSPRALALIQALRAEGLWPPLVPTVVLVESLTGDGTRDAAANRFLRTCDVREGLPISLAQRAAALRTKAGRGSAVDALVAATADPGGTVLTGDAADLRALATHATDVAVETL
jgi:predicted nucleic acid-binding protein